MMAPQTMAVQPRHGPASASQPLARGMHAPEVIARLEEAGSTLLAMRLLGVAPAGMRSSMPEVLHDAIEAYGWEPEPIRAPIPGADAISRMDEAWSWLALVPNNKRVLRRIVAARSLVHPIRGDHCVTWQRVGTIIGAEYRAAKRWHADGIACIVGGLNGGR